MFTPEHMATVAWDAAFKEKQVRDAEAAFENWLDQQNDFSVPLSMLSALRAVYCAGHRQGGHLMLMHVLTVSAGQREAPALPKVKAVG